jgi:hypothetical protein
MRSGTFSQDYLTQVLATLKLLTLAMFMFVLAAGLCLTALWRHRAAPRVSQGRTFAEAIAAGDYQRADAVAREVLAANDAPAPDEAGRAKCKPARERVIHLYDTHVVMSVSVEDFIGVIDPQTALASLLAPYERGGVVYLCGRGNQLRLEGFVEHWGAPRPWLEFDVRSRAGITVEGSLEAREIVISDDGHLSVGVEVWVHLEVPASRDGRLALSTMRPVIEEGLTTLGSPFRGS